PEQRARTGERGAAVPRIEGIGLHCCRPDWTGAGFPRSFVRPGRGRNGILPQAGRRLIAGSAMLRSASSRRGERSRRRAVKALFIRHGAEKTSEGRSLRLLRQWLSPAQRARLAESGYFEVVGCETGKRYRIYPGAMSNVCEIDENGRPRFGLCFRTVGELPIGDVMLAQKIVL